MGRTLSTTTLPGRSEFWERLCAVSNDERVMIRFFPQLLTCAGQTRSGLDIATTLVTAFNKNAPRLSPVDTGRLFVQLEKFAKAIIDDREVLRDALDELRAMGVYVSEKEE